MRKSILFVIVLLLLLSCCTKSNIRRNCFYILVNCTSNNWNDRNNQDYIKLWINDSLLFSGTYYTQYNDTIPDNLEEMETPYGPRVIVDALGMEIVNLDKKKYQDSIKIRIRLIALDDVLFNGKRVMDSTFLYRIDNLPGIAITDAGRRGFFLVFDSVKTPAFWEYM